MVRRRGRTLLHIRVSMLDQPKQPAKMKNSWSQNFKFGSACPIIISTSWSEPIEFRIHIIHVSLGVLGRRAAVTRDEDRLPRPPRLSRLPRLPRFGVGRRPRSGLRCRRRGLSLSLLHLLRRAPATRRAPAPLRRVKSSLGASTWQEALAYSCQHACLAQAICENEKLMEFQFQF